MSAREGGARRCVRQSPVCHTRRGRIAARQIRCRQDIDYFEEHHREYNTSLIVIVERTPPPPTPLAPLPVLTLSAGDTVSSPLGLSTSPENGAPSSISRTSPGSAGGGGESASISKTMQSVRTTAGKGVTVGSTELHAALTLQSTPFRRLFVYT